MLISIDENADWTLNCGEKPFQLSPPEPVTVCDEIYDRLPLFNPQAAPWAKGIPLKGVFAQECSQTDALDKDSVFVKNSGGKLLEDGKDYELDRFWGLIGRLEQGEIGENDPVKISYRYYPSRFDSVIRSGDKLLIRQGKSALATPELPNLEAGEERIANVFYCGKCDALTSEMVYPVMEPAYSWSDRTNLRRPLKTLEKLRRGEHVKILAWGDSVTEGTYLPRQDRWQDQFLAELTLLWPQAEIELVTVGWGGRTMKAFFEEPAGSIHNYEEKVLAQKPDLIISEFVNDAGLPPEQWEKNFSRSLSDFQRIGSEWVILTPHYVRPDWMKFTSGKNIDEDPRPYVKFIREFTAKNQVPLADAALLYGHLWREGFPYQTLMVNAINHPDRRGMKLFVDALLPLFKD